MDDATKKMVGELTKLASNSGLFIEERSIAARAAAALTSLAAERDALAEKLPKTREGVRVSDGEHVWTLYGAERVVICDESGWRAAEPNAIDHDPACPVDECYSTREAAASALAASAPDARGEGAGNG